MAAAPNPKTGSRKCSGRCWAKDNVPARIASLEINPENKGTPAIARVLISMDQ